MSYRRSRDGHFTGSDRLPYSRCAQASGSHPDPARQRARHQPERGAPDRGRQPERQSGDGQPDRGGAGLPAHLGRPDRPGPPAGAGRRQAERQHRGPLVQERGRRAAVRQPAEPRPYGDPRHRPDRGGQPDPRGAGQHRGAGQLAQRRRRPRAGPAARAEPRRDEPRGRPADPQRDHVPRPAAAQLRQLRAPVRRRLRPRRPHHRAAPAGAAPLRSGRHRDRRVLPVQGRSGGRAGAADHPDRARRHGHRERPAGRRPVARS